MPSSTVSALSATSRIEVVQRALNGCRHMKMPTPTQTKSKARIEQPMAKTLPVPTVDSSAAAETGAAAATSDSADREGIRARFGVGLTQSCLSGAVPTPGAVLQGEGVAHEVFLGVDRLADERGRVGRIDDVHLTGAFPDVRGGGHQGCQRGDRIGGGVALQQWDSE